MVGFGLARRYYLGKNAWEPSLTFFGSCLVDNVAWHSGQGMMKRRCSGRLYCIYEDTQFDGPFCVRYP
jgi:hypothetical protein